jgi:hypothetical protein
MQVVLLLKSSDRIAHDICHAFDGCNREPEHPVAFTLALRKWIPLKLEREFRCFVKGHDLIGKPRIRLLLGNLIIPNVTLVQELFLVCRACAFWRLLELVSLWVNKHEMNRHLAQGPMARLSNRLEVLDGAAAAVSQRNIRENPASLEAQRETLTEILLEFFEEHLQHRFTQSDYTFDVYITTAGKVGLPCTSSLSP